MTPDRGGDEFVVLCAQVEPRAGGRNVAERIVSALAVPYVLDDGVVELGASVGLVVAEDCDADPLALLRRADAAMYRAKANGGNGYSIVDSMSGDQVPIDARALGRPHPSRCRDRTSGPSAARTIRGREGRD